MVRAARIKSADQSSTMNFWGRHWHRRTLLVNVILAMVWAEEIPWLIVQFSRALVHYFCTNVPRSITVLLVTSSAICTWSRGKLICKLVLLTIVKKACQAFAVFIQMFT